jgi:hypothetical protein
MRYVKIRPHADTPRSPCGRLVYVECGEPCANGHKPVFVLHEGEEISIPAWAADELAARGHEIIEINEIRDGAHAALPDLGIDDIDVAKEIATAPDHEVDRFLRHRGVHDHLAPPRPQVRSNVPGLAAALGPALKPVVTADELRAKACEHAGVMAEQITCARAARKAAQASPASTAEQ